MKSLFTSLIVCRLALAQIPLHGQEMRNTVPADLAEAAGSFFAKIRGDVSTEVRTRVETNVVAEKEVEALLQAISAISNRIASAGLPERLNAAIQQVGQAGTQAAAALKNPENKSLLEYDFEPLRQRLVSRKSENDVLQSQVSDLAAILQEVRVWTAIVARVESQDQVSEKLKGRLAQLLSQWEGQTTGRRTEPNATEMRWRAKRVPGPEPARGGKISGARSALASGLSPAALTVVKMAQNGVAEEALLTFVHSSRASFALTVDQIIAVKSELPASVVAAMLQRDCLLRGAQGRSARP